jgi:hypothetical protein
MEHETTSPLEQLLNKINETQQIIKSMHIQLNLMVDTIKLMNEKLDEMKLDTKDV